MSAGRCSVFYVVDPVTRAFVWVICESKEEAAGAGGRYLGAPEGTRLVVRMYGGDLLIAPYACNPEHAMAADWRSN